METSDRSAIVGTTLKHLAEAETKLKRLINMYSLNFWSKIELMEQSEIIINEFAKKIPDDLPNKDEYVNGLRYFAETQSKKYYNRMSLLLGAVGFSVIFRQMPMAKSPKIAYALSKRVENGELNVLEPPKFEDYRTYGRVDIENYGKKLRQEIKRLAQEQAGTMPTEQKAMSLWAKTEIDVRSKAQMEMLDNVYSSENDLWWISSHADCSKRCELWQGKLVSKSLPAIDDKMWTGTREGNRKVYSLNGIVNQIDKYGYKNNIIVGFNCRHRLIAYEKGTRPQQDYLGKDIKRERIINDKMRRMERTIRATKTEAVLLSEVDKAKALEMKNLAKLQYQKYVDFAQKNKIAFYPERTNIM